MHKAFTVRAARPADADALTRLARISKAHWGYPQDWLDLWQSDLTIAPETIDGSIGYVAESGAAIIGFWVRASSESEHPTPGWLFVHPDTWAAVSPGHYGKRSAGKAPREGSEAS
jgi:hypothetical protein